MCTQWLWTQCELRPTTILHRMNSFRVDYRQAYLVRILFQIGCGELQSSCVGQRPNSFHLRGENGRQLKEHQAKWEDVHLFVIVPTGGLKWGQGGRVRGNPVGVRRGEMGYDSLCAWRNPDVMLAMSINLCSTMSRTFCSIWPLFIG